jgi:hypothetical protein
MPGRIQMAVVLLALSLIAGACADSARSGEASQPLAKGLVALTAYRATVAGGSASVASSYTYATGDGSASTETGSGVFSWTSDRGQMTYQTTVSGTAIDSTEIIDGHDAYAKTSVVGAPVGDPGAAGGGLWSKTRWSGKTGAGALTDIFFGSPGPPSPGVLLQFLQSRASSMTDRGSQLLGAVRTTHYHALIPFTELSGGKASAAEVRQAEQALGRRSLGIDFWVDSSQLLRKLSFTVTVRRLPSTAPTTTSPGEIAWSPKLPITVTETLDVSDYGVPVDVTPPPASEVTGDGTCQANANGFNCQSASSGS